MKFIKFEFIIYHIFIKNIIKILQNITKSNKTSLKSLKP